MQYTLKKSLGQHFLNDAQVCKDIQAVLLAQPIERLLEVGPGAGALT
ncbi:MAG: 16S rRNA (adenine(1518)-N(6)/adenine(1519)-N(6))-dimethyltransferase, partial [Chitinophagaceae bacterium]|nr:16S rRNA (adenine(1518)-N(6)/adenine(1519)-N(6))-dimethyltransferase [Chitinophagaceae bacterium]